MKEIEHRLRNLEAKHRATDVDRARLAEDDAWVRLMARLDRIRDAAGSTAPRLSVDEVRERLRGLGYFRSVAVAPAMR